MENDEGRVGFSHEGVRNEKEELLRTIDTECQRATPWEREGDEFVLDVSPPVSVGIVSRVHLGSQEVAQDNWRSSVFFNGAGQKQETSRNSLDRAVTTAHCMIERTHSGTPDIITIAERETGLYVRGMSVVPCFGRLQTEQGVRSFSSESDLMHNLDWLREHGGGISSTPVTEGQLPVLVDWTGFHMGKPNDPYGGQNASEQSWYLANGASQIPA